MTLNAFSSGKNVFTPLPIGFWYTLSALSDITVTGQKYPVMIRIQSQGEVKKSSVLSNHPNYNMLRGCYGILA